MIYLGQLIALLNQVFIQKVYYLLLKVKCNSKILII